MKRWCWAAALIAAFVIAGCGDMPRVPDSADDTVQRFASIEGSYRIGVDDRVQIAVWRNPELSVTAPVRPDGKISVPIIGDVEAGGRTPSEVAEIIKKRLSEYVRDPNVAVILTELRSHEFLTRVRVTGAVRTPRSMPHRQGMTVLDAVLEAAQAKAENEKMLKLYKQHVLQEPVPEGGFVPLNSLGGIKPAPVKKAVEKREEIGTFGD